MKYKCFGPLSWDTFFFCRPKVTGVLLSKKRVMFQIIFQGIPNKLPLSTVNLYSRVPYAEDRSPKSHIETRSSLFKHAHYVGGYTLEQATQTGVQSPPLEAFRSRLDRY